VKRALGYWALALFGLGCCLAQPARAASDAGRDLRLEVALIAADARLLADPATPPRRKQGLSERIRSSLGSLAIIARYAAQAGAVQEPQLPEAVADLRARFASGDLPGFAQAAAKVAADHPVDLRYFLPLRTGAPPVHAGRAIYERHCIGCHASPDARAANPAPDLFRMARTATPQELIVRLLAGIHGDRMTSLENPFSDEEIASLAAYFAAAASDAARTR
jgi:mono/diheme cytochrome c family protein